jgi:hypothetical protein
MDFGTPVMRPKIALKRGEIESIKIDTECMWNIEFRMQSDQFRTSGHTPLQNDGFIGFLVKI